MIKEEKYKKKTEKKGKRKKEAKKKKRERKNIKKKTGKSKKERKKEKRKRIKKEEKEEKKKVDADGANNSLKLVLICCYCYSRQPSANCCFLISYAWRHTSSFSSFGSQPRSILR